MCPKLPWYGCEGGVGWYEWEMCVRMCNSNSGKHHSRYSKHCSGRAGEGVLFMSLYVRMSSVWQWVTNPRNVTTVSCWNVTSFINWQLCVLKVAIATSCVCLKLHVFSKYVLYIVCACTWWKLCVLAHLMQVVYLKLYMLHSVWPQNCVYWNLMYWRMYVLMYGEHVNHTCSTDYLLLVVMQTCVQVSN